MSTSIKLDGSISDSKTHLQLRQPPRHEGVIDEGWELRVEASSLPTAIAKLVVAVGDTQAIPPDVKKQLLQYDGLVYEMREYLKGLQGDDTEDDTEADRNAMEPDHWWLRQ